MATNFLIWRQWGYNQDTKFIWKIKNFSCSKEGIISSPSFDWKLVKWSVSICETDIGNGSNSLNVKLHMHPLQNMLSVAINCSLAFLDSQGYPLVWKENYIDFYYVDSETIIFENFIKRNEIFGSRKNEFLPNDNLTLQCYLRSAPIGKNTEFVSLFALTRIEPHTKKSFTWDVTNAFPSNTITKLESMEINGQPLTMKFNLSDWGVKITVSLVPIHLKITISVLDISGKKIQLVDDEFQFEKTGQEFHLQTGITETMIDLYKNAFLRNGTLSLHFSCILLGMGNVTFNSLVDEIANNIESNVDVGHISDPNDCADETVMPIIDVGLASKSDNSSDEHKKKGLNRLDYSKTILQAIQDMYKEGFLSDFCLKVGDRVFPVHKNILGARSPVFRTMFTTEMREKEDNCCVIEDVDGDTVERMLEFVYSDIVADDMGWESASSLYKAADKYALETLMQRCSVLFKRGLSATSVLDVLKLADMHHDQELKSAAFEFILLNHKDIIGSEQWKRFEEENKQLAFDVFRYLYFKKMVE